MSQTNEQKKVSTAGNGSTTAFAWSAPLEDETGIKVVVKTNSTGAESLKTLTTHYTVAIADDKGSATITMLTAPTSSPAETLTLSLNTNITQSSTYSRHNTIEGDLDKLTQIALSQQEQLDRALKMPVGDGEDDGGTAFITEIPAIEGATAGDTLVVNSGKTALEYNSTSDVGHVVGPTTATDHALARYDLATGNLIQDSGIIVDDSDNVSGVGTIATGALTVTGAIAVSTTVDGRDVATDGTKLDAIEASADVTDATNVNAAGATMNTDSTMAGNSYFLDEDDLTSDSATQVASQQSIKAYVDASAGGGGDVSAASNFGTDNLIVRSDGTLKGVQATGISVSDADAVTGVASLNTAILNASGLSTFSGVVVAEKSLVTSKGGDLASATQLITGSDGNFFDVTGTTTITSILTSVVGIEITLQFDGILTLTHHATDLILPGGANITTAAGDVGRFVEYASGDWVCVNWQNSNIAGASGWSQTLYPDGQNGIIATSSNGATIAREDFISSGNGRVECFTADFITGSQKYVVGNMRTPSSYDGGAIDFTFTITQLSVTSGDTVWNVYAGIIDDGDDIDTVSLAATATDTITMGGAFHDMKEFTLSVTPTNASAGAKQLYFSIKRNAGSGSDTFSNTAQLINVEVSQ